MTTKRYRARYNNDERNNGLTVKMREMMIAMNVTGFRSSSFLI